TMDYSILFHHSFIQSLTHSFTHSQTHDHTNSQPFQVFRNSLMFPFSLTLIGLSFIFIAVQYQQFEHYITAFVESVTPRLVCPFFHELVFGCMRECEWISEWVSE